MLTQEVLFLLAGVLEGYQFGLHVIGYKSLMKESDIHIPPLALN